MYISDNLLNKIFKLIMEKLGARDKYSFFFPYSDCATLKQVDGKYTCQILFYRYNNDTYKGKISINLINLVDKLYVPPFDDVIEEYVKINYQDIKNNFPDRDIEKIKKDINDKIDFLYTNEFKNEIKELCLKYCEFKYLKNYAEWITEEELNLVKQADEDEFNKKIKSIWKKIDFQKVFNNYSKTRSYDITSILQGIVNDIDEETQKIIDYIINTISTDKYEIDKFFNNELSSNVRDKYYDFIRKNTQALKTNIDSKIKTNIKKYAKEMLTTYVFKMDYSVGINLLEKLIKVPDDDSYIQDFDLRDIGREHFPNKKEIFNCLFESKNIKDAQKKYEYLLNTFFEYFNTELDYELKDSITLYNVKKSYEDAGGGGYYGTRTLLVYEFCLDNNRYKFERKVGLSVNRYWNE